MSIPLLRVTTSRCSSKVVVIPSAPQYYRPCPGRFGIVVKTNAANRNSFATTGDGAAINKKLMAELQGFFLWCVCHLLALAVRDALPVRSPGQDPSELPRASAVLHMAKQVLCRLCVSPANPSTPRPGLLPPLLLALHTTCLNAGCFLLYSVSCVLVRLFPA